MQAATTLLIVYNIDSGVLLSVHDYSMSRPVASGTAASNLHTLTQSPIGIKKEWKRFLKELKIPSRSLDRDEFEQEFGRHNLSFPAILLRKGTELSLLINTEEIDRCRELGDLIDLVNERLALI